MLLWCSAAKQGFQDERWLTYKQAQELGGRFVKVNTARRPSFTRLWRKRTRTGNRKIPMLKAFTVFNVEQIDGLSIESVPQPVAGFDPLPQAEALMTRSGAKITEQGVKAFYRPATDEIVLPERFRFADAANFYATGLHELVHWTGQRPASIVKKAISLALRRMRLRN